MTQLHLIKNIKIENIGVRSLKIFCSAVGISGQRQKGKYDVCKAIVGAKTDDKFVQLKDRAVEKKKAASDDNGEKKGSGRVTINCCWFLNVLFGDIIRPHFATIGDTLTKVDLDEGRRQDQVFHELVAVEYNKIGIASYDNDAFLELTSSRCIHPSSFQEIDWKKSEESFKTITNEYDECSKHWKVSGFHGDIPTGLHEMTAVAKDPFENYGQNINIQYMHKFVYRFPDVLSNVTGK